MAYNINKKEEVSAVRKTRVETTYEYVPIIGEILGYWRKVMQDRMGDEIILFIKTPLNRYDALIINGEEIEMEKVKSNKKSTPVRE